LGLLPTSRLLSLRLRFLPIWFLRFLLDIRSLLVHQMGFLAMARVRSAPILEIRRPGLLHPKGTICKRRDHKGAVRPDDARPTTAQPRIPKHLGDAKTRRVILPLVFFREFFGPFPKARKKLQRVAAQNGETLVKLKSLANIPGCSIAVPVNDVFRMGSVNPSMFLNRSRRLWLNLRFLTGLLISPFSTRKVPSRVMPVRVLVRGSTSRMYQSLVNNNPLSNSPTSSSVFLVPPF